jgi:hypothetical protein
VRNKFIQKVTRPDEHPFGREVLYARGPRYSTGQAVPEELTSDTFSEWKNVVVWGDPYTEGSQTAKSGTDE